MRDFRLPNVLTRRHGIEGDYVMWTWSMQGLTVMSGLLIYWTSGMQAH